MRTDAMSDDWRLQIDVHEEDHAYALIEHLGARHLQHDLSEAFQDRVIVSRDGARVFLYSGTREQAEKAREFLAKEDRQQRWTVDVQLRHWHPVAEEWMDPGTPLPVDDAANAAERAALMAREREETAKRGYPEFEVRVDLPSHHYAVTLAEQLRSEGLPTVRRWRYLLVGVPDEDSGKMIAERIRTEAPPGSRVDVEGTWSSVNAMRAVNPFAVLGGLRR